VEEVSTATSTLAKASVQGLSRSDRFGLSGGPRGILGCCVLFYFAFLFCFFILFGTLPEKGRNAKCRRKTKRKKNNNAKKRTWLLGPVLTAIAARTAKMRCVAQRRVVAVGCGLPPYASAPTATSITPRRRRTGRLHNRGWSTFNNGLVEGFPGAVGNTPLIRLRHLSEETGCEILGKAEFMKYVHLPAVCKTTNLGFRKNIIFFLFFPFINLLIF
jgi:hypothetical protein